MGNTKSRKLFAYTTDWVELCCGCSLSLKKAAIFPARHNRVCTHQIISKSCHTTYSDVSTNATLITAQMYIASCESKNKLCSFSPFLPGWDGLDHRTEDEINVPLKMVKPYKCFQSQCGKGRLLQVAEQPSVKSRVLSLCSVFETIKHLFMIKICVTVYGQGQ